MQPSPAPRSCGDHNSGWSRVRPRGPRIAGSSNDYDYVGGDPINRDDLDGRCWRFWNCKYKTIRDGYGSKITLRRHIQDKIWRKHGISLGGLKAALRVARRERERPGVYRYWARIQKIQCYNVCRVTQTVLMKIVVDFRTRPQDMRQMGVVSAYCIRPNTDRCPSWVND